MFDKITSRIQKLCYGLNMDFIDPVSKAGVNSCPHTLLSKLYFQAQVQEAFAQWVHSLPGLTAITSHDDSTALVHILFIGLSLLLFLLSSPSIPSRYHFVFSHLFIFMKQAKKMSCLKVSWQLCQSAKHFSSKKFTSSQPISIWPYIWNPPRPVYAAC